MSEKVYSSPLLEVPVPQESELAKRRHSIEDLERKAVRKIDYHILPVMSMFYLLSFLVSAPSHGNPCNLRLR